MLTQPQERQGEVCDKTNHLAVWGKAILSLKQHKATETVVLKAKCSVVTVTELLQTATHRSSMALQPHSRERLEPQG